MTNVAELNAALAGRYAIEREAGAGGMATVYVARDLRHDRRVALKVLHPELAAALGSERFLAEIRTTANLQHPHILPLHDSGEAGGFLYYVMPFVEGETLRARLERERQLPLEDAVRVTREVLGALDYAHRHGVVHRDVKPENVLLHDGTALVADFGIALAVTAAGGARMTQTGLSLGTPQYMSPEQAMGERHIDGRADVYAAGAVLYEMLTGEPPFSGATIQAIVAKVMTERPTPPSTVRDTVPRHIESAVLRALAKLPADRFATAAQFAESLGDAPTNVTTSTRTSAGAARPRVTRWLADPRTVALLVAATALLVGTLWRRTTRDSGTSGEVTRLVLMPTDTTLGLANQQRLHGSPAGSPDGRTIAFSVARGDTTELLVQPLDRFEQWTVPGGGRAPFFSPDGRWIGFLRGGVAWKVRVDGGEPTRLGAIIPDQAATNLYGAGVWHPNGRIYFNSYDSVTSIPASGGVPGAFSVTVAGARPVGVGVLGLTPNARLLVVAGVAGQERLAIVGPDGGELVLLPTDLQSPAWFAGDVFVFTRERQRYAARLDLRRLRLEDEAIPINDLPLSASISSGPTIAWLDAGSARRLQPVWVTRTGVVTPIVSLPPADYRWPRLSPDGRRIALNAGRTSVEVVDVSTGARLGLTTSGVQVGRTEPVWLHDGRVLTSLEAGGGKYGLMAQMGDGSRAPDTLLAPSAQDAWPTDVSRDDGLVFYYGVPAGDPQDVFVLDMRTKAIRRVMRPGAQRGARLSPDGRWLAMETRDAGRGDVIVLPWPALDAQYVVSPDGGTEPTWSRDGRELFFREGSRVLALRVSAAPAWVTSPPVELFRGPYARDAWGDQSWDIGPDGRFLLLRYTGESPLRIHVIENWTTELHKKLAAGRR